MAISFSCLRLFGKKPEALEKAKWFYGQSQKLNPTQAMHFLAGVNRLFFSEFCRFV